MILRISLSKKLRFIGIVLTAICSMTANLSVLQAGLVSNGGDLEKDFNNALRFDPATPTPAKVAFVDANLPLDRYIQVGFRTNNPSAFNITEIAWSKDNISYTNFTPNNFVNDINSPTDYRYSDIIDLGAIIGGSSTTPFYIRYTIPAGIEIGKGIQSKFLANADAFATNGVLDFGQNNNFIALTRSHTAVPEPTSLMLVSSVALLLRWRLKSRSKRAC